MITIIDNYDSFTYNLYQYIGEIDPDIRVFRNDRTTAAEILGMKPSHVVISPGPGFPKDAGRSIDIIREVSGKIPLLGVCLGHQAIAEAFGGVVVHSLKLMHGKTSDISIDNSTGIFAGLPEIITAGRYHSLTVDRESLPSCLAVTAWTVENGEIMGIKHTCHHTYGVQFHPESILTPMGKAILKNFLDIGGNKRKLCGEELKGL